MDDTADTAVSKVREYYRLVDADDVSGLLAPSSPKPPSTAAPAMSRCAARPI